ncbi:MAG: hypothetical protein ACP5RC_02150 [Halothiobacillaceae bacterium]
MAEPGTPRWFLDELFGGKPDELYLLVWTLADKRSRWFRDLDAAASAVEALTGRDVYVGVGLAPRDYGPTQRCPSEEIAGIVALWADFDLRSDAHQKKALPATIQDALRIIPEPFSPTLVVATGNGAHAWWLFKEPLIFDNDEERREAARLIARWQTLLRLNAAARGWAFDRLSDLARVLRIPGTVNAKDPANLKPVTLFSNSGRRYNPSDFEDWLDEAAIPDPATEEQIARDFAQRFQDQPLVINLNARIPQEMIDRWMEADLRFRNTWLKQRHDLKDQSQSGYDLALACFGFEAGLDEQQIVDLIVHHRRLHNERQRTRLDYFRRTLGKAAARALASESASARPLLSPSEVPQASIAIEQPSPAGDSPTAKALLCERISQALRIRILRLVKVTGKEPTYQMELEGATIEFPNFRKFVDQTSVRMAIGSATNKLIPKIKPKLWEQIAQTMLDALIETEGGEETDFKGAIRMYLNQYLTDTAFIETIENQPAGTLRCPTVLDGRIAICSSDLQQHVNKTFSQALSVKAIASMLAAIGAVNITVKGMTFKPQSRWLLPPEEFDPDQFTTQREPEEAAHVR